MKVASTVENPAFLKRHRRKPDCSLLKRMWTGHGSARMLFGEIKHI